MKIRCNFQFNYSGKLAVLCIKSPKKVHKILVHKIQQALAEFFLRHCESECLWLLNSPETGKKVCLEKIHQPKPKESKLIFENYFTGVCKIFIMINSFSLSNISKIIFKYECAGLRLGISH